MNVKGLILQWIVSGLAIFAANVTFGAEPQEDSRKVIASIKPLGLITEAVVAGSNIEVDTLLPAASSPHHYALKISDAKRLQGADLVIWLGDDAEPYINPAKTKSHLALLGHINQEQLIEGGEGAGHDHRHVVDPHIWLDPLLAQDIATLVAGRLIALYPDQQVLIQKNLDAFRDRNQALDQKLSKLLSRYGDRGFLVYHDAYAYFVRRYGLKQLGVIQEQIGGSMSVRHLRDLQKLAGPDEAICLFREPQFAKAPVPELGGGGRRIKDGTLDPLGIQAQSYEQLLESLANQLVSCFDEGPTK